MDLSGEARSGEEELLGYPNLKHNLLSEAAAGVLLPGQGTHGWWPPQWGPYFLGAPARQSLGRWRECIFQKLCSLQSREKSYLSLPRESLCIPAQCR